MQFEKDVENLVKILEVLSADAELVDDTQFARRAYVRAVFAMIEGDLNLMTDVILRAARRNEVEFQPGEEALLRQERYSLDDRERVQTIPTYQPLLKRFRFVLRVFGRIAGKPDYEVDVSGSGWSCFKSSNDLRNTLAHPRSVACFEVNDDALKQLEECRAWIVESMSSVLEKF